MSYKKDNVKVGIGLILIAFVIGFTITILQDVNTPLYSYTGFNESISYSHDTTNQTTNQIDLYRLANSSLEYSENDVNCNEDSFVYFDNITLIDNQNKLFRALNIKNRSTGNLNIQKNFNHLNDNNTHFQLSLLDISECLLVFYQSDNSSTEYYSFTGSDERVIAFTITDTKIERWMDATIISYSDISLYVFDFQFLYNSVNVSLYDNQTFIDSGVIALENNINESKYCALDHTLLANEPINSLIGLDSEFNPFYYNFSCVNFTFQLNVNSKPINSLGYDILLENNGTSDFTVTFLENLELNDYYQITINSVKYYNTTIPSSLPNDSYFNISIVSYSVDNNFTMNFTIDCETITRIFATIDYAENLFVPMILVGFSLMIVSALIQYKDKIKLS